MGATFGQPACAHSFSHIDLYRREQQLHELLLYAAAGGSVGFIVGMTGVGGGSLMTPLLLLFGFSPSVAIGTDLLYAAITKAGGVVTHSRQKTVEWQIVGLMAAGSLPSAILTMFFLHHLQNRGVEYNNILTTTLGIMLIITALVLLFRTTLLRERHQLAGEHSTVGLFEKRHAKGLTWFMGVILGAMVTLSSVGAGAFAAAVLMMLYPRMAIIRIIGTDLAHAVPLTAIAGIGHITLGHVNWNLLAGLLIGSLPAIWLGTKLAYKVPNKVMQPLMATVLLLLGIKYVVG